MSKMSLPQTPLPQQWTTINPKTISAIVIDTLSPTAFVKGRIAFGHSSPSQTASHLVFLQLMCELVNFIEL